MFDRNLCFNPPEAAHELEWLRDEVLATFRKAYPAFRLYTKLRQRLEGANADRLAETQRTWLKYRDENCSVERELYGKGTAAGPAYLACLEAMTRARTKELQITYPVRLKD
jgi:prophage antirepressor-like protein